MPLMKSETTLAHNWRFDALGTSWEIASGVPIGDATKKRVTKQLALFELTFSRFIGDSFVSVIADKPGSYTFPSDAKEIFSLYEELYELTDGKVTPLVGEALADAGYDARYSLQSKKEIHPVPRYGEVVQRKGNVITTNQPVMFDVGAVGKGYAVDTIIELLKADGYSSFVVDASGDMRIVGDTTQQVGLENPHNFEEVIGTVDLHNKALCASASNRRKWGEWHHIIDPNTASPTHEIIATWVVADSAMVADGLATALFFTSPETLRAKYTYEYMRMHADGSVEYSDYFAKGIFE